MCKQSYHLIGCIYGLLMSYYIYDESTESCLMINTDSDNDDEYDDDSPDRR